MNHHTTADFWNCYNQLPDAIRKPADANFELLRADSCHPSLHFKRVGRFWSVRVGIGYRAVAVENDDGLVWFWIGSHPEYFLLIQGR